jgi:uracil-DNA glycosylase family protein
VASVPPVESIAALRQAAEACRGCTLWQRATQTVFGSGADHGRLMLVGEQPGDQEDRAGEPFVGPAGHLLDRALVDAGIDRAEVYVTNAVKHFKWEQRGKRRLHKKPSASEVAACHPWLEAEIAVVDPRVVVTRDRGQPIERGPRVVVVTIHPSAILRVPEGGDREGEFRQFAGDLATAARIVSAASG